MLLYRAHYYLAVEWECSDTISQAVCAKETLRDLQWKKEKVKERESEIKS